MNTLNINRSLLFKAVAPVASDRLPDSMLAALKAHGLSAPVRGINDPRLQYPELLLIDGWDRDDTPSGCRFCYTCSGQAGDNGERYEQSYQAGCDGGSMLLTRCGHTETIIRQDPQGRINTSYRMV